MFIQLDDKWALTSDEYCWKLQRFQEPKEEGAKGSWKSKYYCTTFDGVIKRLALIRIRLNDATTIEELIEHAKSVHTELKQLLDYEIEKGE
jgi:hypothetical protein